MLPFPVYYYDFIIFKGLVLLTRLARLTYPQAHVGKLRLGGRTRSQRAVKREAAGWGANTCVGVGVSAPLPPAAALVLRELQGPLMPGATPGPPWATFPAVLGRTRLL